MWRCFTGIWRHATASDQNLDELLADRGAAVGRIRDAEDILLRRIVKCQQDANREDDAARAQLHNKNKMAAAACLARKKVTMTLWPRSADCRNQLYTDEIVNLENLRVSVRRTILAFETASTNAELAKTMRDSTAVLRKLAGQAALQDVGAILEETREVQDDVSLATGALAGPGEELTQGDLSVSRELADMEREVNAEIAEGLSLPPVPFTHRVPAAAASPPSRVKSAEEGEEDAEAERQIAKLQRKVKAVTAAL